MKAVLPALHVSFAALWLGCVLTEALFERALLGKGPDARLTLAHLHVRVDKFIELPAILVVLISGGLLLAQGGRSGLAFQLMLGAGLIAIAANLYCVGLVFKRRDAAVAGDWVRFEALDHRQHQIGALVLVGLLLALGAGYVSRVPA